MKTTSRSSSKTSFSSHLYVSKRKSCKQLFSACEISDACAFLPSFFLNLSGAISPHQGGLMDPLINFLSCSVNLSCYGK
jgi:hypothetical protein